MLRTALAVLVALAIPAATMAQDIPHSDQIAPEFRLKGDVVSLPFVMVQEFPFVEAEVQGVKGKLMLDTGALDALILNHNPLKLPAGRVIGQGRFGSGQSFEKVLRPSVDNVRLPGGLAYDRVTTFRSQDAAQLERITPDFLGWLGYWFWEGYAVKLDYKASKATFYKAGPKAFLKGETLIAAIPFETRALPDDPVLSAKIGDRVFHTVLDTGQYGSIFADTATLAHLQAAGAIKPAAGKDDAIDIAALRFSNGPPISIAALPTHPVAAAAPFATAIGLNPGPILSLGYAFLKQYKTVWDYPHKTLYLLKR